jgi:hypothetical protein
MEQVIEGNNIEGGTFTLSWTGTAAATVNGSAVAKNGQVTLTANTNATVRFSGGTVGLVQLEAGSVATPFERRPYGLELALCQRYYATGITPSILSTGAGSFGGNISKGYFPVFMRVTPTLTVATPTGGGGSVGTFGFTTSGVDGYLVYFASSNPSGAYLNGATYTASAEL